VFETERGFITGIDLIMAREDLAALDIHLARVVRVPEYCDAPAQAAPVRARCKSQGPRVGDCDEGQELRSPGGVVDRDVLILPDALIEGTPSNLPMMFKGTFDALWQSSGWEQSPGYDRNGTWDEKAHRAGQRTVSSRFIVSADGCKHGDCGGHKGVPSASITRANPFG
jgi:hypothetical protein